MYSQSENFKTKTIVCAVRCVGDRSRSFGSATHRLLVGAVLSRIVPNGTLRECASEAGAHGGGAVRFLSAIGSRDRVAAPRASQEPSFGNSLARRVSVSRARVVSNGTGARSANRQSQKVAGARAWVAGR